MVKVVLLSSVAGTISAPVCSITALKDRVEKLERLVGKLTLENEFLKRGLWTSHSQPDGNGKSSRNGEASSPASSGGAF